MQLSNDNNADDVATADADDEWRVLMTVATMLMMRTMMRTMMRMMNGSQYG